MAMALKPVGDLGPMQGHCSDEPAQLILGNVEN